LAQICGESVEDPFQAGHHIHLSFLKSVQHGHEHAAGAGSGIGQRAEADFAGDDRRPQIAFGEGVLSWRLPVARPVVEAVGVPPEDVLETAEA
jgi:hypothetical protein